MDEPGSGTSAADVAKKIGKMLEERRKLRKLSIGDVCSSLKIRPAFIESLEKGAWEQLPGDVYVRGFSIRYAQFLGLNGQEVFATYQDALGQVKPTTEQPAHSLRPDFEKFRPNWAWVCVGLVLLVAFIKFMIPDATKTAPAKPVAPVEKVTPAPEPAKRTALSHKLDVFSPTPLWLRVQTQDRTFEGFIPKDSTWSLKGEGEFSIRLGHTKNVALYFDAALVPLQDNQKKVVLPHAN